MTFPKFFAPATALALLGACATIPAANTGSVQRGGVIFAKECSQCHGRAGDGAGPASLGLGIAAPDLTTLTARNDGIFPHAFVQRFVLGKLEKEDPDAAMPDFGTVGLEHANSAGEVTSGDMIALLDYLETIQK